MEINYIFFKGQVIFSEVINKFSFKGTCSIQLYNTHLFTMSITPEYTRRAIKKYQEKNKEVIRQRRQLYYQQNAEEFKRKRRERYQQQKLITVH